MNVVLDEMSLSRQDQAFVDLGRELRRAGYHFTTITPLSHQRVVARAANSDRSLRDIFGWSRSFKAGQLPASVLGKLREAEALDDADGVLRSKVRFSSLGDQLFVHSAFPTAQNDAVFFGPDTYRFARAIHELVALQPPRTNMRVLDVGAGSGIGGLYAARLLHECSPRVVLTDINERALRYCTINTVLNDVANVQMVPSDLYANIEGTFDLIVSNPPYLVDGLERAYRHGGGEFGSLLSMRILEEGIDRLASAGQLLLYTGSAIVDGVDLFKKHLEEQLSRRSLRFSYEEIDPDVFGEELEHPPYDRADRLTAVAVHVQAA
jgi:methylase of polypeptide subunit release factors